MINTKEKRPLEPRDHEYIVFALDAAAERKEPITEQMYLFEDFELTRSERNRLILESAYKNDQELVSLLTLFG